MERRMMRMTVETLPAGRLASELARFGEQQHENGGGGIDRFATCITAGGNAKANSGVYRLFTSFVRTLAAKDSVEEADGEAVEACRKICDLMGWLPREV